MTIPSAVVPFVHPARPFIFIVLCLVHPVSSVYSDTPDTLSQRAAVAFPATVITATRIPTIITAVNRTYEIVQPSTMSAVPPLSLEEVVRHSLVGGIQSRGVFGVQTDMNIRGSTFSQSLVLLNGQRLNDPQTGHHTFDLPVTVDDIDRIEIVKGHASTQYGADAFAGVVNIITKRPAGERLTLRVGGGEHGLLTGGVSMTTGGAAVRTRNIFEIKTSDGFRDGTEFTLWSITTHNEVNSPLGGYTLTGGYTKKKFGAFDFYSPGRNAASKEKTAVGWLALETEFMAGSAWIHPRIYFRRHDDEFIYVPGSIPNIHTTHAGGGEITGIVPFDGNTSLLLGIEVNQDRIASTSLGDHRRTTFALFSTFQTVFADALSLDVGARQDWHSEYGLQFSPSFGIGYLLSGTTKIFASAGRSFRAPSYTDLYYHDPANSGNPDLVPETGWSFEFGIRNGSLRNINVTSAVFLRDQTDLIDYVQFFDRDQYHAVNFTDAKTRGGECGIEWTNESRLPDHENDGFVRAARLDYLYLDSHIDCGNSFRTKYSLNHPVHSFSALVNLRLPAGVDASISGIWKKRLEEEAAALIDVGMRKEFKPVSAYLKVVNILNTRYEDFIGVPSPGRWVWGGIEVAIH